MADITAGGKSVDDKSKQLKLRRLDLDLKVLVLANHRLDFEMLELEDQIERKKEAKEANIHRIAELEKLLEEGNREE